MKIARIIYGISFFAVCLILLRIMLIFLEFADFKSGTDALVTFIAGLFWLGGNTYISGVVAGKDAEARRQNRSKYGGYSDGHIPPIYRRSKRDDPE